MLCLAAKWKQKVVYLCFLIPFPAHSILKSHWDFSFFGCENLQRRMIDNTKEKHHKKQYFTLNDIYSNHVIV